MNLALFTARLWLCAGMLAAPLASARSDVRITGTVGDWSSIAGVAINGQFQCGMMNYDASSSRAVGIKWQRNLSDRLLIQVSKSNWRVPTGTRMTIALQMDQNPVWSGVATGTSSANGLSFAEMSVPLREIRTFINEFRGGSVLRVSFPDGSEPTWFISLRGSNAVSDLFSSCVGSFPEGRGSPEPTQPHGSAAPTQPFRPNSFRPSAPESGGNQVPSGRPSEPTGPQQLEPIAGPQRRT